MSNQTADNFGNEVVLEGNELLLTDHERKSDTNVWNCSTSTYGFLEE